MHMRKDLGTNESKKREAFHYAMRLESKKVFEKKYDSRKKRVRNTSVTSHPDQKGERRKIGHIRRLMERSERTRVSPIQRKNREQRLTRSTGDEFSQFKMKDPKELDVRGTEMFEQMDEQGEVLRASPTTQYFAKVKNLLRIRERRSDQVGRGKAGSDRVKKRRKVPEKKRNQRYPHWTELEVWRNRVVQKVEDANLKKVLKGEKVDRSYATYRELGKKVRYLYAVERSEVVDDAKNRSEKNEESKDKRG